MDHSYFRSLDENGNNNLGSHFPLPSEVLDPAALLQQIHQQHHIHHQQHHHQPQQQERLDLNLNLAPPPTMDSSSRLGLLRSPLGSADILDMPHNNPYLWNHHHHLSHHHHGSTPPSPGELDFTVFQNQSSPWGLDFSEAAEHLDLDLSPLLQDHLLHQQQELDEEQQQQQQRDHHNFGDYRLNQVQDLDANQVQDDNSQGDNQQQQQPGNQVKNTPKMSTLSVPSCSQHQQRQAATPSPTSDDNDTNSANNSAFFDCNVCLDAASEPVVTTCGHLFCWPCLYQWLHLHSHNAECPVCKGSVTDEDIIPIYGRGGGKQQHKDSPDLQQQQARNEIIPPRPRARRAESVRQQALQHRVTGGDGAMLHEMLRWRRAVRFMQENVDRLFHARNSSRRSSQAQQVTQQHHRRRLPERRDGFRFGAGSRASEELLLAAAAVHGHGLDHHHHHHHHGSAAAASIQARISSVEGMIEQLQQPWQSTPSPILPPQAYIDLATSSPTPEGGNSPLFAPPLQHDPYAYQILHGLRRMPV